MVDIQGHMPPDKDNKHTHPPLPTHMSHEHLLPNFLPTQMSHEHILPNFLPTHHHHLGGRLFHT